MGRLHGNPSSGVLQGSPPRVPYRGPIQESSRWSSKGGPQGFSFEGSPPAIPSVGPRTGVPTSESHQSGTLEGSSSGSPFRGLPPGDSLGWFPSRGSRPRCFIQRASWGGLVGSPTRGQLESPLHGVPCRGYLPMGPLENVFRVVSPGVPTLGPLKVVPSRCPLQVVHSSVHFRGSLKMVPCREFPSKRPL